jgi:hypothetical protein
MGATEDRFGELVEERDGVFAGRCATACDEFKAGVRARGEVRRRARAKDRELGQRWRVDWMFGAVQTRAQSTFLTRWR